MKRFKEYDIKYKQLRNTFMAYETDKLDWIKQQASSCSGLTMLMLMIRTFDRDTVHKIVYEMPCAENWQRFRVSLQGQSTALKVVRLQYRWVTMQDMVQDLLNKGMFTTADADQLLYFEEVRINNYLKALRRGGQLDGQYRIIK